MSINKPFKDVLKHLWEQYMVEQSDEGIDSIKSQSLDSIWHTNDASEINLGGMCSDGHRIASSDT